MRYFSSPSATRTPGDLLTPPRLKRDHREQASCNQSGATMTSGTQHDAPSPRARNAYSHSLPSGRQMSVTLSSRSLRPEPSETPDAPPTRSGRATQGAVGAHSEVHGAQPPRAHDTSPPAKRVAHTERSCFLTFFSIGTSSLQTGEGLIN